jgi:hypothetical protein
VATGAGSASLQLTIPTFKPDAEPGQISNPAPDTALHTMSHNETYNLATPQSPQVTSPFGSMTSPMPHMISQIPELASRNLQNTSHYDVTTSPNVSGTSPFDHLPTLRNQQLAQSNSQILNAQGFR